MECRFWKVSRQSRSDLIIQIKSSQLRPLGPWIPWLLVLKGHRLGLYLLLTVTYPELVENNFSAILQRAYRLSPPQSTPAKVVFRTWLEIWILYPLDKRSSMWTIPILNKKEYKSCSKIIRIRRSCKAKWSWNLPFYCRCYHIIQINLFKQFHTLSSKVCIMSRYIFIAWYMDSEVEGKYVVSPFSLQNRVWIDWAAACLHIKEVFCKIGLRILIALYKTPFII